MSMQVKATTALLTVARASIPMEGPLLMTTMWSSAQEQSKNYFLKQWGILIEDFFSI